MIFVIYKQIKPNKTLTFALFRFCKFVSKSKKKYVSIRVDPDN